MGMHPDFGGGDASPGGVRQIALASGGGSARAALDARPARCRRQRASWIRWIPFYRTLPTYRSLDKHLRGELRILLSQEARRWIKEDVLAGRTAKVHLAIARRSSRPC